MDQQGLLEEDLLKRHILTCRACAWFAEQLKPIIAEIVAPLQVTVAKGDPFLPQPVHDWPPADIYRLRQTYGYGPDPALFPKTMVAWAEILGIHRTTLYAWESGHAIPRRIHKLRLDELFRNWEELQEETT